MLVGPGPGAVVPDPGLFGAWAGALPNRTIGGPGWSDPAGIQPNRTIDGPDWSGWAGTLPNRTIGGPDWSGPAGELPNRTIDGRVHYYEGYDMKQVVLPVCVMARLGVDAVILTNAVGSLNPEFQPGTLMCIDDHIASFVPSPLIGPNDSELGDRFTDMIALVTATVVAVGRSEAAPSAAVTCGC